MNSIILANEFLAGTRPGRLVTLENLCGMSLLERHIRTLTKSGVSTISIIVPQELEATRMLTETVKNLGKKVQLVEWNRAAQSLQEEGETLIIAGNYYIEKQFIDYLINEPRPCLLLDNGPDNSRQSVAIGCARVNNGALRKILQKGNCSWEGVVASLHGDETLHKLDVEVLPTYNHSLRRHRSSKWMKVDDDSALKTVREWIIEGAQKGSLDLPAKVLHAPIENYIVSKLCEFSITPNQLTLLTNIVAWLVTWGILSGFLWVSLIGAALVGIMDGLDGKLARAKVMTSRLGELEHLFDMLFEYSWWLSLGWVLGSGSSNSSAFMAGVGLVIVSLADVLIGVIFWAVRGRAHNRTIDNYTPFELAVRKIGGRRNIYIWLLLVAGPFTGLETALWLCVAWGIVTIFIRGGRALWLGSTRRTPMDFAF